MRKNAFDIAIGPNYGFLKNIWGWGVFGLHVLGEKGYRENNFGQKERGARILSYNR